jgi:sterol desaturase/sphingolipid hydroxylase (fatty acid hydroxylase superfamily)
MRRFLPWRTSAIAVAYGGLTAAELQSPLRSTTESKVTRIARNSAFAVLGAATLALIEVPMVLALTRRVETNRIGILPRLRLPRIAETALAILALDWTMYLWHRASHVFPLLWRFHQPHHVDRDCDVSTGLRFHPGELALSMIWRAVQVAGIGVRRDAYALWESLFLLEVFFHHSNVRLPERVERIVSLLLVTPRMHGIHHEGRREFTESNWSSGLSIWDRLHGTLRLDVPQDAAPIGLPAYRGNDDVRFARVLALPFGPERDAFAAAS